MILYFQFFIPLNFNFVLLYVLADPFKSLSITKKENTTHALATPNHCLLQPPKEKSKT